MFCHSFVAKARWVEILFMLINIIAEMVELGTERKQCNYMNCISVAVVFLVWISTIKMFIFTTASFFVVFWDRVSLCSPHCPGTHSIDQDCLERTLKSTSLASQVLGLKACTPLPSSTTALAIEFGWSFCGFLIYRTSGHICVERSP